MSKENIFTKVILLAGIFLSSIPIASAQPGVHTSRTGGEVLRQMRNEKLDLILPGAMRDSDVDMWIHVTRPGDPDPLVPQFGSTSGYLIFTDRGDRIERAVFGGAGAVEKIDVYGSPEIVRAVTGYDYGTLDFSVYDELTEFVAERDPKTIAVNYSSWISSADGISHTEYLKLEKILGSKYSQRIISAENVISEFLARRVLREVTALTNTLETRRQIVAEALTLIMPGVTTREDIGWWTREEAYKRHLTGFSTSGGGPSVLYSAVSDLSETRSPHYVLQRGDFFYLGAPVRYMDFGTDTKTYAYILREGETRAPESIQYAYDQAIAGQWIMWDHMKVGMTAGESLDAMVQAMEEAGYLYTPFNDDGKDDLIVQKSLANTNKSGFSIDNHAFGNNRNDGDSDILNRIGPSMSPFRPDRHHLVIQENNFFAFEYMVHTNLPERPGFPLSINVCNVQIISNRGVEWLQPPNEKIELIF